MRIHPRPLLLRDLPAPLSPELRSLMKHLASCERCRRRLGGLFKGRPARPTDRSAVVLPWSTRDSGYSPAITAAEESLRVHARSLAAERGAAPTRLAELLEQPQERREMLVRNQSRFQTWGVLERLIEHSREQCFVDPISAENLARLAVCLTHLLDSSHYGAERIEDLRARAWGYVGNSLRLQFQLQEAEKAFTTAFTHLRSGTGDVLEKALLLDLQASLLRGQRRLAEAERTLLRVLRIYRELGETHRQGRALISLTTIYEQMGTQERSIPLLHEAMKLIDDKMEPRLLWNVHHNLILALADVGRFMEAQGWLIRARPLYARFQDGPVRNRHHWVAGKIARGLGQAREAEVYLESARAGFMAEGAPYDAVVVSLDLATLFAEQGRVLELKQIAEEMLTIFSSRQIHREALAALSFLHQAASAERVSLEVVSEVATHLKRLRYDPELKFQSAAI